jgi:hypothetical protein
MTLIAPAPQGFFTDRLLGQRNASPHTVAAYRDTLRLLLTFASQRIGKPVSQPRIDDLGVTPTLIAHHGRTRQQKTQGAGPACRAGSGLSISHSETTGQSLST